MTKFQLWERKLLDMSMSNNLINMSVGKNALSVDKRNIAIFEDEGDTFYVAKCKSSRRANDITVYSNIFTYDYSGRLYKRA